MRHTHRYMAFALVLCSVCAAFPEVFVAPAGASADVVGWGGLGAGAAGDGGGGVVAVW